MSRAKEPGTTAKEAAALAEALGQLDDLWRLHRVQIGVYTDAEITVEAGPEREGVVYRLVRDEHGYQLREQYR